MECLWREVGITIANKVARRPYLSSDREESPKGRERGHGRDPG